MSEHFDFFVIGGGSGGIAAARRAAGYGAKVGVAEYSRWGGTCVNVGCVPKKVMFNTAMISEMMHEAHHFGYDIDTSRVKFDWKTIKHKRDAYVKKLNTIYDTNLEKSAITKYIGKASFTGPKSLRIERATDAGGPLEVTASHVLVATGGYPQPFGLPGEEYTISSDGFFELEDQPKKVAVIGAGYIAVELAGIFNALGSETHLFTRGDTALRRFDDMLKTVLTAEMKRAGMHLHPGSTPAGLKKEADGSLTLSLQNGQSHGGFDTVLVATGRMPCVDSLNLPAAGVKQAPKKGYIEADEYQNTNVEGIYALGDVCGKVELTPMAIAAGRRLADRLFGGMNDAKVSYDLVPTVIFSHPTIGTIGPTEEECKKKYGEDNIKVYKATFPNLYYGPWTVAPEEKPKTAMKLVCLLPEEKIIALHVIGMGADEMLQGFGIALKMGATKADFDSCVAIHPTASEEFVTMAPWGMAPQRRGA